MFQILEIRGKRFEYSNNILAQKLLNPNPNIRYSRKRFPNPNNSFISDCHIVKLPCTWHTDLVHVHAESAGHTVPPRFTPRRRSTRTFTVSMSYHEFEYGYHHETSRRGSPGSYSRRRCIRGRRWGQGVPSSSRCRACSRRLTRPTSRHWPRR